MMTDYVGGPGNDIFNLFGADGDAKVDGGGGYDILNIDFVGMLKPPSPGIFGATLAGNQLFITATPSARVQFNDIEQLTINARGAYLQILSADIAVRVEGGAGSALALYLTDETAGRRFIYDRDAVSHIGNVSFQDIDRLTLATGGGNDVLIGGAGYEIFIGGGGDDILDSGVGGGGGLVGGEGNDILYGRSPDALLEGGAGDDVIRFLADKLGSAVIQGGEGNDIFYLEQPIPILEDAASSGGVDEVRSGMADYVLPAGVENFRGLSAQGQQARGNDLPNRMVGNAGNDVIEGGAGDDRLLGGGGVDSVSYEHAAAAVIVSLAAGMARGGAGNDRLAGFENIRGSAYDDRLVGDDGGNILSGLDGADRMIGLGGDDDYWVDNPGDRVVEAAGGGQDRVFAAIDYRLPYEVETLFLLGRASIDGRGNDLANFLVGNSGYNRLAGGGGGDVLTGGAGRDSFVFDTRLGPDNVDRITDFVVGEDHIQLARTVFGGVKGALPADAFVIGGAAVDASDRILYDSASGALFFDADGSGGGAAVQFARLTPGLALSAADLLVV
ncbi:MULTISPECIES: hypothetical protein [unclassified Sphingobium]|uniref:hypothetical protein n=1 Tax=unclassified Sphingobium TaxID=2611147 RepID=UPI0035A58BBF